jgi:hypothetical protein
MGLATENIPMPPVASAVKVMPSKWNCGDRIASAMDTSCTTIAAVGAVVVAVLLSAVVVGVVIVAGPPGTNEG